VEASDASHYFGVEPAIELEKLTNGVDADEPPGVEIVAGAPITWTYVITNTGNVTLTAVSLVDDRLGVVDCVNTTLAAGESMTCFASELAVAGPYVNVATATGQPPSGQQAEDTDSSHYFGIEPSIAIEKFTNGVDADLPPGVEIGVGEPITWTYVVTNTGSVELSEIAVVDDQGVDVTCPQTVLEVGESMTCSAGGVAGEGPYVNVGTASGQPPTGEPVSAADASHYLGGQILHADDFESGDTSAWDGRKPP
jgi:hypothetical protein